MVIDEINRIQREIDLLPQGYISHKTINGKVYHYRQQRRGGKTVGQYIPEGQYEYVAAGIARRKELQKELADLRNRLYYAVPEQDNPVDWPMDVRIGGKLKQFIAPVAGLERRECYNAVTDYLYSGAEAKVCALYGLRRTGKTTLICQVIKDMTERKFARTAYIKAEKGQDMTTLGKCLEALSAMGYKYVFLDEITKIDDFLDRASTLSDIYAQEGMKIVLSGTDSLVFWFAARRELYDRVYFVHTTWIPFREHSRLLKTADVDDYIELGGILYGSRPVDKAEDKETGESAFTDLTETQAYIKTSIAENLQHSLEFYRSGDWRDPFRHLYKNDELANAVSRIVEDMNHEFVAEVFNDEFVASDPDSNLEMTAPGTKGGRTDLLNRTDRKAVAQRLMERLNTNDSKDRSADTDESLASQIRGYLSCIEATADIILKTRFEDPEDIVHVVQPGLRYCQVNAIIESLKDDSVNIGCDQNEKGAVCGLIRNAVKGRMLEEIVQYETMKSLDRNYKVVKFRFRDEELDMVVHSKKTNTCQVYEVQYSTKRTPELSKHLRNDVICNETEKVYGPITGRFVLYRGEDFTDKDGIRYLNVSDWLRNLPDSAVIK